MSPPWLLCTGCARHGHNEREHSVAGWARNRCCRKPLLYPSTATLRIYGGTLRPAQRARKERHAHQHISLRIILWIQNTSTCGSRGCVRCLIKPAKKKFLKAEKPSAASLPKSCFDDQDLRCGQAPQRPRRERLHSQVSVCHGDRHACPAP